ncbi:MAG TPA: ectoine synthase [Thermoleophilaceae bacterium]|jgi:L-ectoine synthase
MIVRSRQELIGSDREVDWGNGTSVRLLVERDGSPYTVTHTTVNAGSESLLCYQRHVEACYCIEGSGEIVAEDGSVHRLEPGVMYSPGKGEPHRLRAETPLHLVCVFSPALCGSERHRLGDTASSY